MFDHETGDDGPVFLTSYGVGLADFAVIPDKVAAGAESLAFSLDLADRLPTEMHWYLAVQDGMSEQAVADAWEEFEELGLPLFGIFVGGTRRWKWRTAAAWVRFAHARNARCHVGGVSSHARLVEAELIGADSVDSTAFGVFVDYERVEKARVAARGQSRLSLFDFG